MAFGFQDFTVGQQMTADIMDGVMRQTVMGFATATARNTALAGVLTEGMIAYQEDTDSLWVYDGANWYPAAGRIGANLGQSGQAIGTATTATLTYNSETEDIGGFHVGSGQFIVPTGFDGTYALHVRAAMSAPPNGNCAIKILVGGAEVSIDAVPAGTSSMATSITLPLTATSTITAQVFNGHSGSLTFAGTFRGYLVGLAA